MKPTVDLKKILLFVYMLSIFSTSAVVMMSIFGIIPLADVPVLGSLWVTTNPNDVSDSIKDNKEVYRPNLPENTPTTLPVLGTETILREDLPVAPTYTVAMQTVTDQVREGGAAAFTWFVSGPVKIINTSTVYFGQTSVSGHIGTTVSPTSTAYSDLIPDFINGTYKIPLTFTAGKTFKEAGTYYARAYAEIDGKHYWGDEVQISVLPKPKYEIKVVDWPKTVKSGEGMAFVWEISGPPATTGYTVIAVSTESSPEPLDDKTALTQTNYHALVNDFTNGSINIPLRFIGNARIGETGTYYFRALAFIDNKNIWSPEYTFTVE